MPPPRIYLLDTNAIIESVRIGIWKALSGALDIQTVDACAQECRHGDATSAGYVAVQESDLSRMSIIHPVSERERAMLLLRTDASSLDLGELDLHAYAFGLAAGGWSICSPDRASVTVGVALGWQDRLISLEELVGLVGARPRPPLRPHFLTRWLSLERTKALLDV